MEESLLVGGLVDATALTDRNTTQASSNPRRCPKAAWACLGNKKGVKMQITKEREMAFNKGDIIIKAGAVYPHGSLAVDGYDDQGSLLAHPEGGGLQYVFTPADQQTFRRVPPHEQKGSPWKASRFSLDGIEGVFEGWARGQLWNGWEMPCFEFQEAQKLIGALHEPKVEYDSARDLFTTRDTGDEDEAWLAQSITVLGPSQVKVYPIGAGSWCWEEVSNEQP
jgi:hypothetical protein